jgi:hypothetical protein
MQWAQTFWNIIMLNKQKGMQETDWIWRILMMYITLRITGVLDFIHHPELKNQFFNFWEFWGNSLFFYFQDKPTVWYIMSQKTQLRS